MAAFTIKNMKPFEKKNIFAFPKDITTKRFDLEVEKDKSLILAPSMTYLFRKTIEKKQQPNESLQSKAKHIGSTFF